MPGIPPSEKSRQTKPVDILAGVDTKSRTAGVPTGWVFLICLIHLIAVAWLAVVLASGWEQMDGTRWVWVFEIAIGLTALVGLFLMRIWALYLLIGAWVIVGVLLTISMGRLPTPSFIPLPIVMFVYLFRIRHRMI